MSNLINKSSFPDEEWVTSHEIMRFFAISKSTLHRWNQSQQIPRTLIGGTYYYPKKFIQQLMLYKLELPPDVTMPPSFNIAGDNNTDTTTGSGTD